MRFEHSPGRGHPAYTADHTAFDVLIRCTTPQGHDAFVAIEIKYSEAPAGAASPCRPRYDALSRTAGVFTDPNSPALRHAPIEQFWREQLLLAAMLERGHYQHGRLLVIAPALNTECQAAIVRYRAELIADDPAETRFQALTLEDVTTAISAAGADTIATRVTERYLDFTPVHRALAETFNTPPAAARTVAAQTCQQSIPEERDRVCDFVRFADPTGCGKLIDHYFHEIRCILKIGIHHFRVHESRANRVDSDALLTIVDRCGFCQTNHPKLARTVGGMSYVAWFLAINRGDIDDRATTILQHLWDLVPQSS